MKKKATTTTTKKKPARGLVIPDLAQGVEAEAYIPHEALPYHDHDGMLGMLMLSAAQDLPALIIGETGTGKTSAVRYLAKENGVAFRRVNLNGGTTADELVGRILLNKEGTYWIDGVLTDAMRKGHWIILDEINAAGADVLFCLHSLLDDDRMLVLTENGGEVVRPHAGFRLFATANPSGEYAGTRELNKALLSRFPLVLTAGFPQVARELALVAERTDLKPDLAETLVKVADAARAAHKESKLDMVFSTRDVLNVAKIASLLGGEQKHLKAALKACIAGKCSREDAAAIADLVKTHSAPDSAPVIAHV